ncbi:MAG: amino acid racemase [Bryobacterales bacterium]|nr:amino acid racemase [Bryobacterales bacterium]MBV9398253.1 amino acid racemase [Bryobacterales bacterium]
MRQNAKHIGIVACSAEGAALCYRTICGEGEVLMGPHNHPEISMHTFPFAAHVDCMRNDDWQSVADLLVASGEKLARIGADFLICPDNTAHKAMPLIGARAPLPWLHIADTVAQEALRRGYKKVGLTGTKALVESDVYPEKLARAGVDFERADSRERQEVDHIIFEELVRGVTTSESFRSLYAVAARMKTCGCEAVILGCTELPLLAEGHEFPLPVLDSTRLLARAALAKAVDTSA